MATTCLFGLTHTFALSFEGMKETTSPKIIVQWFLSFLRPLLLVWFPTCERGKSRCWKSNHHIDEQLLCNRALTLLFMIIIIKKLITSQSDWWALRKEWMNHPHIYISRKLLLLHLAPPYAFIMWMLTLRYCVQCIPCAYVSLQPDMDQMTCTILISSELPYTIYFSESLFFKQRSSFLFFLFTFFISIWRKLLSKYNR